MPLVFACIAPHGNQAVAELTPNPQEGALTQRAMTQLGQRLAALQPDTVVILTPHGIRIDGAMCISASTRAAGSLSEVVSVDFDVDQTIAAAIAVASRHEGVPVASCIYGASAGPNCSIPLDWGAIIPLWHMGHAFQPKPKVVVICPSRALSREQMVAFGRAIATVAESSQNRVALIASSDHGHAHSADGPYGLDPASAEYDAQMCQAVEANDLKRLLTTDPALVEAAKPDSLWQMLILAGALEVKPLPGELLSYEVPTYFGMLCAAYQAK
jgi:aromatic ring-opening dioxygenase LigB subunit